MDTRHGNTKIRVEVVLAMPERQELRELEMLNGSTIAEAIEKSGLPELFESFNFDLTKVGVFGHKASPDHVLRDGDRVEIYRSLIADPKEVRRQRAVSQSKADSRK